MNPKYIFVGQINGRLDYLRSIIARFSGKEYKLCFTGNIFGGIEAPAKRIHSHHVMASLLRKVDTGDSPMWKATCLIDRDDAQYFLDGASRTTVYEKAIQTFLGKRKFLDGMGEPFKLWTVKSCNRTILFTPHGLSNRIWSSKTGNISEELSTWYENSALSPWNWIGTPIKGNAHCGGPLWCDSLTEFTHIPGIVQIFGGAHSLPTDSPLNQIPDDNSEFDICLNAWPNYVFQVDSSIPEWNKKFSWIKI